MPPRWKKRIFLALALALAWLGAKYLLPVFTPFLLGGLLALGILSVLFPVLSRFENSFAGLLKNTVLLALANLPRTLALGIVNAAAVLLCARFIFPLFFLPSLAALVGSLFLEPMFRPYMQQEA